MTPFGTAALVTGTDSLGMGRAIALHLAEAGIDVALHWYRSRDRAEELAQLVQAMGRRTVLVHADLGDPAAARAAVREAHAALGSLPVVVCNAGMIQRKKLLDITDADWDRVHAVNLRGTFCVAQEAARLMVAAGGGGRIVMISSVNQAHANPDIARSPPSRSGGALNRWRPGAPA